MNKYNFLSFYKDIPNQKALSDCYDAVSRALMYADIFTDLTLIGALATVRTEVGRTFLPLTENVLSGFKYEGRKDLGNIKIGDGVKYRGRGYIQLTGRSNYTKYGITLGLDLVGNPDLLLDPIVSAKVLAQYFKDRACNVACNEQNWPLVRELVNGGTNGLTTFLQVIYQYKLISKNMEKLEIKSFGYDETSNKTKIEYDTYNVEDLNNREAGTWIEDGNLTEDQVLELAKSRIEPGKEIEVVLNLNGASQQPQGDGSVK